MNRLPEHISAADVNFAAPPCVAAVDTAPSMTEDASARHSTDGALPVSYAPAGRSTCARQPADRTVIAWMKSILSAIVLLPIIAGLIVVLLQLTEGGTTATSWIRSLLNW